jgi:hypothetical protein
VADHPRTFVSFRNLGTGRCTKTPEIKPFDIIDDERQDEEYVADQFFSSLLGHEFGSAGLPPGNLEGLLLSFVFWRSRNILRGL